MLSSWRNDMIVQVDRDVQCLDVAAVDVSELIVTVGAADNRIDLSRISAATLLGVDVR